MHTHVTYILGIAKMTIAVAVIGMLLRPGPILEADTGFHQSQASLIWQELEEEEDWQREDPSRGLFWPAVRARRARATADEEEEDRGGLVAGHQQDRVSDYSDDDRVRYFILGTLAAVFALLLNFIYTLLSGSHWI
ncbi:hypothetical protein P4O66_004583 [Electrophorus voltai]|uniref:Uncharacterized protein n=1 Tax=Electrophorus voltai TaxID=2609070 RepID=A0AAD8ZLF1_9TELE|nr:hypothetical protein P4O66_004583 [Electrophorus voltai]